MDPSALFRIGDVARLFHISVSSLRHYEAAGLLIPEYIDPETGYRYYSTRQFEVLNTIRYLRALDLPLSEIADFLQNRDIDRIEEKLRHQKNTVIEKQKELKRIEHKIDNRLHQLHDARTSELDVVKSITLPACRLVWMEASLRIKGFLDMETSIRKLETSQSEAVVFLGKVGVGISAQNLMCGRFEQYDGAFLVLDEEDHFEGETTLLPQTSGVSIRFCGSHPEAPAQYRRLMNYIEEKHLTISGFSREITMIDYGITNDTEKFVTQISIPVR